MRVPEVHIYFLRDRTRRKIIPAINLGDFKILDEETDPSICLWRKSEPCITWTCLTIPNGRVPGISLLWLALPGSGFPISMGLNRKLYGTGCCIRNKASRSTSGISSHFLFGIWTAKGQPAARRKLNGFFLGDNVCRKYFI